MINTLTEREIGWIAGILEGEGHILCNPKPVIGIGNTDLWILKRLQNLLGCGAIYNNTSNSSPEHWKQVWTYRITKSEDCKQVLKILYSELSPRRQVAARKVIRWKPRQHSLYKLSKDDVFQIRKLCKQGWTTREVGESFNISPGHVSAICTGKRHRN